jgi:hypothetical protein
MKVVAWYQWLLPVILAIQEDQEDGGSKPTQAKYFMRSYLKKKGW